MSVPPRYIDQSTAPTVDPLPQATDAPAGTVDALLQHIDFARRDDPLLPLAYLFAQTDVPTIDRLFLASNHPLLSITAQQQGPYIEIFSSYAPDISVRQSIRCDAGAYAGPSVTVPDEVWDVEVSAPAGQPDASFTSDLHSIPFAHVRAFTQLDARFDTAALLDARTQESGHHEVARLSWRGGLVAPVEGQSNWGPEYTSSIVVVQDLKPENNSLGAGTPCRDYSTSISFGLTTHQGYAYAVSKRPSDRFAVSTPGRSPIEIPMAPAADRLRAGLVDLTDLPITLETTIIVTDVSGQAVPCLQQP